MQESGQWNKYLEVHGKNLDFVLSVAQRVEGDLKDHAVAKEVWAMRAEVQAQYTFDHMCKLCRLWKALHEASVAYLAGGLLSSY